MTRSVATSIAAALVCRAAFVKVRVRSESGWAVFHSRPSVNDEGLRMAFDHDGDLGGVWSIVLASHLAPKLTHMAGPSGPVDPLLFGHTSLGLQGYYSQRLKL